MNNQSQVNLTDIAYAAMLERQLDPDFSSAVEDELTHINKPAGCPVGSQARDLRDKLFFSIDNDDSRDLDQLTYAEALPKGEFTIYVAIADVDSLVKRNSAIDSHAQHNTTSVYTPTKIFTMLPEKLSYDLTSLNPDADRTSMVVQVHLSADGTLKEHSLYPACVHNYAKLTYNALAKWLTEEGPAPEAISSSPQLASQVRLQDKIAQILKESRIKQGSLILDTIETKPILKDNRVVELEEQLKNRARELIEEFMIATNTATTQFLEEKNCPSLRRVVRVPKNWDRIVVLANKYGTRLPETPNAKALQVFLDGRQKADPESFPDLSLAVIKLLGRGEYIVWAPGESVSGHFGLALKRYTHATAPNRRYPDLITQRLLKAVIAGITPPYGETELSSLANHCTEQEDNAEKVQRKVQKSAAAMLLLPMIGQSFGGIITGASDRGTWVRVFRPPVEGKVIRGFQGLEVGERVRVKLVQVNVEQGFIDFELDQSKQ